MTNPQVNNQLAAIKDSIRRLRIHAQVAETWPGSYDDIAVNLRKRLARLEADLADVNKKYGLTHTVGR